MTRKPQQTKRKREDSPDDTSKTRQKRTKGGKSSQVLLSAFAAGDSSKAWMDELQNVEDLTQVHAQAACGFGPLGHKQCCPNKFTRTTLKPIGEDTKIPVEVIDISDSEEEVQYVCSQSKCKANPYCLNYLGQDKWESSNGGMKAIKNLMETKSGGDPSRLLRAQDMPVGLRNLGATCYANAFIQVWNQQNAFRSAVFQCIPPIFEAQTLETSPIFQLQVTFAALSYGNAACFDPTPLIESLKLNRGEQQDAQEFAKLFLSHLAEQFAKQSSPHLKNIVASQFEGLSIYGTLCHGCGYKSAQETRFLEIEIGIMNKSNLEECLQESLESEVLTGDNKYRCPQCQSLQDATRYSEIRELPPVLHFSVQRFVFDLKTLSRKKSKNVIRYPLSINVARWKQDDPSSMESSPIPEDAYDLCGVLIHKGSSAYSGHYESQVLDTRTKRWYQFNDEEVTELPRMGDASGELSSKDCYCLIYTRRSPAETPQESPVLPSEEVSAKVTNLDSALLSKRDAFAAKMQSNIDAYQSTRERMSEIYRSWNLTRNLESFKIVNREDLLEFIRRDFPKDSETNRKPNTPEDIKLDEDSVQAAGVEAIPVPVIPSQLSCEHGRLDPNRASQFKLINEASHDRIVESYPEMRDLNQCQEICLLCTRNIVEEYRYRSSHCNAIQEFENALEESDEQKGEAEYWISKKWLKDWRLIKPKMHSVGGLDPGPHEGSFRPDVYCEHDGLTLEISSRVKIPGDAGAIIKQHFPSWEPFSTDTESCIICTERVQATRTDRLASLKDADFERITLKKLLASNPITAERKIAPSVTYAILPSEWIRLWRNWINKPKNNDRPGTADTSPFVCEHGGILFNPSVPSELANPHFCVIHEDEWDHIVQLRYPNSGPSILLKAGEGAEVKCNMDVCQKCYRPPITEQDALELSIHLLQRTDKRPTLESHLMAKELISNSKNLFMLFPFASRRPRRVKHGGVTGRFLSVRIAKNSTVLELKEMIEEIEKIPPFYQELYYEGEEMSESKVKLEDVGLEMRDVLQWRSLAEPDVLEILDDGSDAEVSVTKVISPPKRVEGRAFQGTLLAGL